MGFRVVSIAAAAAITAAFFLRTAPIPLPPAAFTGKRALVFGVAGTEPRSDGTADVATPREKCHRRGGSGDAGACAADDDAAYVAQPMEQSYRHSGSGVAGTESRKDGAADDAEPQRYAACIGGSCTVSG